MPFKNMLPFEFRQKHFFLFYGFLFSLSKTNFRQKHFFLFYGFLFSSSKTNFRQKHFFLFYGFLFSLSKTNYSNIKMIWSKYTMNNVHNITSLQIH